jgi:prepilin signal peptidase PulO-like enzyme (type II secretory pathway)
LRRQKIVAALVMVVIVAALAYAVISYATNWADWVVFGVLVLTVIGAAIAIYPRQYPTRKRTFVRESDNRWR